MSKKAIHHCIWRWWVLTASLVSKIFLGTYLGSGIACSPIATLRGPQLLGEFSSTVSSRTGKRIFLSLDTEFSKLGAKPCIQAALALNRVFLSWVGGEWLSSALPYQDWGAMVGTPLPEGTESALQVVVLSWWLALAFMDVLMKCPFPYKRQWDAVSFTALQVGSS